MAGGLVGGVLLGQNSIPPVLAGSEAVSQVKVESRDFSDSRQVAVEAVTATVASPVSPLSGRITRLNCDPTQPWASGTSPMAVDGAPVLALHTDVPFWRDFAPGVRGDDVIALQTELAALERPVPVTGVYDRATRNAISDLLKSVGVGARSTLQLGQLIWIPDRTIPFSACALKLGDYVAAGQPLLTTVERPIAFSTTGTLSDLAVGDRQLRVGDVSVPVDANGRVVDAEAVAALAGTPEYLAIANSEDQKLAGVLELVAPMRVWVVPPSSLVDPAGDSPCVFGPNSEAIPVDIVASSLGRTFVVPRSSEPLTSVIARPSEGARCSS